MIDKPVPPNPLKHGKRSTQVAWPIMQTAKYVGQAESYMAQQAATISQLRDALENAHGTLLAFNGDSIGPEDYEHMVEETIDAIWGVLNGTTK